MYSVHAVRECGHMWLSVPRPMSSSVCNSTTSVGVLCLCLPTISTTSSVSGNYWAIQIVSLAVHDTGLGWWKQGGGMLRVITSRFVCFMPLTFKLFGHGAGGWESGDGNLGDGRWWLYLNTVNCSTQSTQPPFFLLLLCFDILLIRPVPRTFMSPSWKYLR